MLLLPIWVKCGVHQALTTKQIVVRILKSSLCINGGILTGALWFEPWLVIALAQYAITGKMFDKTKRGGDISLWLQKGL